MPGQAPAGGGAGGTGARKKLIGWIEWIDDPLRPVRTALLEERGEAEEVVELLAQNRDVARVYMLTRGQVVTAGQGEVVDLHIPAIKIVMDLLEVTDQKRVLERVLRVFHHFEATRRENDARP